MTWRWKVTVCCVAGGGLGALLGYVIGDGARGPVGVMTGIGLIVGVLVLAAIE